jgi:hypothetical protein
MGPDNGLIVIFASLHVVALLLGGLLFAIFVRTDAKPGNSEADDEDEGGGGGNDRLGGSPKTSPSGGIPLPDAEPAPIRLRGPGRLADLRPRRQRRGAPVHPRPAPHRVPAR